MTAPGFDPALVAPLDEPVRRYFLHALRPGAPLHASVRLEMRGRVRAGAWLPFTARQETARDGFAWVASIGVGGFRPLQVVDHYAAGEASMEGRLFGRRRLFRAADEDTRRSAAGRVALEAVAFAPGALLPGRGVTWRAEGDDEIVAAWDVPPERPEVRVRLHPSGAVRSVSALRWGDRGRRDFGYLPCGAEVHAERRFGDVVVPSRITVAWWFGTPRHAPFFAADITELTPAGELRATPLRAAGRP